LRANLTNQHYQSAWSYSAFAGRQVEHTTQADADLVWPLGERNELDVGGVWRRRSRTDAGTAAVDSTDLAPGAPTRTTGAAVVPREPGVYAEDKLRLVGPLYATLGGRVDRGAAADEWNVDPRGAVAWRVDERQTVRVAAGRYHQLA